MCVVVGASECLRVCACVCARMYLCLREFAFVRACLREFVSV